MKNLKSIWLPIIALFALWSCNPTGEGDDSNNNPPPDLGASSSSIGGPPIVDPVDTNGGDTPEPIDTNTTAPETPTGSSSSAVFIPGERSSSAGGSGTDTTVTPGVPGENQLVYAINSGGAKVSSGDITYQEDRFADGGTPHEVTKTISGTTNQQLFRTERYGDFSYSVPVTNGTYSVTLHFAELYQSAASARSFDVSVQGKSLFKNMDLFAEVGAATAHSVSMENIQVSDGKLNITLKSNKDNATICGFEIWSSTGGKFVEPPPPPPPEPGTATDEDTGLDCVVGKPSGSNGGSSTVLPDPFTFWDGTTVKTKEDWRCRRRELVTEVENRILGPKAPPPESVTGTISNTSYTVNVSNKGQSISFNGKISLPRSGSAPYPAIIMIGGGGMFNSLNSDVLESEGVATIDYNNNDIKPETAGNYSNGKYYTVNPDFKNKTSALVAWAWGISRIIDMIEKNPTVIDPTKIGVTGCSRLGKAAFVAGAFDERIALSIPVEPGTGGPAPLRALLSLDTAGQSVSSANGEASWFASVSGSYNANSAAADMDAVAMMYAPRGLLLMDNPHIGHLSYKANYLGMASAEKVYNAMGKKDAIWYLGNSGNGNHCSVRAEYGTALKNMIQKHFKGKAVTTGGMDKHTNHGNINVDSWTKGWNVGTIQ